MIWILYTRISFHWMVLDKEKVWCSLVNKARNVSWKTCQHVVYDRTHVQYTMGMNQLKNICMIEVCSCLTLCLLKSVFTLTKKINIYGKTCLKRNLKGPEHFSAKARFPFNQGTLHIKIKPGHAHIWDKIKHHTR